MAWYRTGTVSVTNGSTAVTGSGTNFVAGAQVGEGFAAPDGRLYEIVTIVSATSLTIGKAYLGSTQTGQTYEIVPTQSLVADLAGQVSTLISDFQSVADEAGEGKFDYGTAASPGITFTLDQDTGFFHDTNNEIGVSAGGTKVAEFNSGGLSVTGTITGTSLDMNGNADFSGNINLSQATSSTIKRNDNTGFFSILGGADALSAGLTMFGNTHATLPNWTVLEGNTIIFRPVDDSPQYLSFVDGTGVVFNENSADLDFRIESDTNTHAFFLQGSDGKIGIGTASPLQPLHVNSSGNTQLLVSSSFNNSTNTGLTVDTVGDSSVARFNVTKSGVTQGTFKYLHAATAADQAWQFTASSSTVYEAGYAEHIWKTGNTERLRITSTGKVGINDSAPPTILSVRGDTPESRITNTNAISDTGGTEEVARLGVYGQRNTVYGPAANIVFRQDASSWSNVEQYQKGTRIEFCTQDATATDTSETPRMVIDKDGDVGIGTSSPTDKLHLSQDSAFAIQMERTGASPSVCEIQNGGSLLNISNNATGIVFLTGPTPTEKMRIDASGRAIIPNGVTLGTAAGTYNAANTLDDYEEGTWTPTFASLTGEFGSIGYLFNTGTYTKVGRLVTVTGRIQVSGAPPTIGTAGGNCHLSGFPFVIASGQNFYGAMSLTYFTGWSDSFAPNSAYISQGASLAVLMKRPVPGNNEFLFTPADFISGGANSGFMFTATYFTT
jgi:hypothetical protein